MPFQVQVQLHDKTVSRWISQQDADARVARGEAVRVSRKAHQPFKIIRLCKPVEPSDSPNSPASITEGEMHINARAIECSEVHLAEVQEKVLAFEPLMLEVVLA